MRKFLLLLAFALSALIPGAQAQGPIVGPGQPILCTKIVNMAVGPTGSTQIVAAVAGQIIAFCGWHVTNSGATGTFSISFGTGSNCGSTPIVIVTPQSVTSTAPSADHIDYATISSPTGYALCINPSVATVAGTIYYSQF